MGAACVALLPAAERVSGRREAGSIIRGSESARVDEALRSRFDSPFAQQALLVITGLGSVSSEEGREEFGEIVDTVRRVTGVRRPLSFLDHGDRLLLGAGERDALVVVGMTAELAPDSMIRALRGATRSVEGRLRARHPDLALRWTGTAAISHDLRRASAADARRSALRALPLTIALLLLAFGAVGAALVPVAFGGLSIGLTLGAAAVAVARWPLSIMLQNVVLVLGLALSIDYALLMVTRFRSAPAVGLSAEEAAREAARRGGHTILLPDCAVAIGFMALLVVPINELRSVAAGGLLVSLAATLLVTTLLPGGLAWLGPRIDLGRVRRKGRDMRPRRPGASGESG